MRRIARVDGNQAEIVSQLKARGCSVLSLAALGKGCPDLLVGWHGENMLLEVKDGAKVPSARKLTTDEVAFHQTWRGRVAVVDSVTAALAAVGLHR